MLLKNLASMGALNIFKSVIQFAMNLVLAKFISPSDYGLVVFTLPFVAFITMLTDLGLSSTLVRQPGLTPQQAGGALTLVLTAGSVSALALAGVSFAIQSATGMAGLQPIMAAMSGVVILSIAATPPRALLERRLNYPLIARIEGAAVVISAVLSVIAVTWGAGVWAIVFYNALLHLLRLTAFISCARNDFALNWSWSKVVPMLSFGGWVLAANLLIFAARNGDNILIGTWLGAADVGLYGLAYQFMLVPMMIISWPASSVLLATLSRHRNEPQQFKSIICSTCAVTAALIFPLMGYFMFGLEYPLTSFMPPNWHAIPAIVFWLAPLGAIQTITSYNGVILLAKGEARLQFWVSLVGSAITLATFIVALPFGLMVLVKAYVGTGVFIAIGFLTVALKKVDIGWPDIVNSILPGFLATVGGLAAVGLASHAYSDNVWSWLANSFVYGVVVLAVYALMRHQLTRYWHELIRERAAGAAAIV
jgi:O-antigen/teichoic acid export membrane protein